MTKKKTVTVSMKPTHFSVSSVKKSPHRTSQAKPRKSGSTNHSTHTRKSSQEPVNKTQNQAHAPRFNYRLLTYQTVQDIAGTIVRIFYDGNIFQQVVVLKPIYKTWNRASQDQKRQYIANQLNIQLFGNNVRIVWNVCNTIMGFVDAVVSNYVMQELAKQQAQMRRT
jgi:hypothetical protein